MTAKERELLILAADLYVERIHDRLCYAQNFYARSAKDQRAIAILSADLSDAVNLRNLLNDLEPEPQGRGPGGRRERADPHRREAHAR
jgi:hypothetical protein